MYFNIILQKKILNSLIGKYKIKAILIIYITEVVVNTMGYKIKRVKQIEDSVSSNFEDTIEHQCLDIIISNLRLELDYYSMIEF